MYSSTHPLRGVRPQRPPGPLRGRGHVDVPDAERASASMIAFCTAGRADGASLADALSPSGL
jgi:hypothetical protein